jgi:hypothetical protein
MENELEIYHNQTKLCSHKLIKNGIGIFITDQLHMPTNSNAYREWNSERYLNWAKQKGVNVYKVILRHFESVKIEQQQYKSVHSILKLADRFGNARLESACQFALEHISCPSYKNLKMILINNQAVDVRSIKKSQETKQSKFLRGAKYYE